MATKIDCKNQDKTMKIIIEYIKQQRREGSRNWKFATHTAFLNIGDLSISLDWEYTGKGAILHFQNNPNNYYITCPDELNELLELADLLSWRNDTGKNRPSTSDFAIISQLGKKLRLTEGEKLFVKKYLHKIAEEYTTRYSDFHFSELIYTHRQTWTKLADYECGRAIINVYKDIFNPLAGVKYEHQLKAMILHELCHSVYPSHRKEFWELLNNRIKSEKLLNNSWFHPLLFDNNSRRKEYSEIETPIS